MSAILQNRKRLITVLTGGLIALALLSVYALYSPYDAVREETIINLNRQQMTHARLAAHGIENFFNDQLNDLRLIASMPGIVHLDGEGRKYLDEYYRAMMDRIRGISRIDARGKVRYTAPYDPKQTKADISLFKHFQEVRRTGKPYVSEVVTIARGFRSVVIEVPVFRNGRFDGVVGTAVSFEHLAREFLEKIRIGKTGYAWMISRDGTELFCPVPGHIGKNVSETCQGFPDLLAVAGSMMQGKEGITTYAYNRVRENVKETVLKHAVYMPVRLGNTHWSVIVATPEDEIVAAMESFRNRWLALLFLLLAIGLIAGYTTLRAWWIVREQKNREQAERVLRESEEKYRNIFEQASEGIFQSTPEGKYLRINPALARMSGYASPEQMIASVTDIGSQLYADPAERKEFRRRIEAEGRLENFEFWAKRRDGGRFRTSVNARVVREADGKILFYEGTQEDITARKQAEEALKATNRKLNDIIEFLPDATFVVDKDNRVIAWNRAIEEMTGVKKEEIIGKGDYAYTVPFYGEARPNILGLIDRVDEDVERKYDYTRRKDRVVCGEVFVPKVYGGRGAHVWAIVAPLFDSEGRQAGAIESVRDITEFKEAEAALRQSEENYRLVIENSRDAIFILQDEVIQFPNPRTLQLFGYAAAELREVVFTNCVHPEDRDVAVMQQQKILKGRGGNATFRIIANNGGVLWVENSAVAVKWKEKRATLNFMRDITVQKNIEAQLQNTHKMEAVGTLAGGIAHDFNNLLMSINGYAALMLHDLEENHPHFELLKRIQEQVRSGADLTKQLLGFARGGRYEVEPIDVNDVVEKTSTMFGRTKKDVFIHRRLQTDLWSVEADRGQLEQVMLNLFVNAWQAMPEGGSLYLATKNVTVEEGYAKSFGLKAGRFVRISVTDTGIGMDEETRKRIFEPFFTTKEMGRGVGLGLASVYGIVRGHHGFINVYSEKDKGSTFNVYLPASDKKPEIREAPRERIIEGSETVLVVDDEAMILDVGCEMLRRLGYKVLEASSGRQAVDLYRERGSGIDLVILDMVMPGMGGAEVFDELKAVNPDVRVVLSTGYSLNGLASGIMAKGCRSFIQKPFGMAELSQKVREALAKP